MASHPTRDRAVERIRTICRGGDDERSLRQELLDELRRHVGYDVHVWLLTDPVTEVGSAPLADAPVPADLPRLIHAKYLTPVNRWTRLVTPVATLLDTTQGARERSLVWREVLSTYGVTDVASLVFRDDYGCWGWLDLWRLGGEPFTPEEQSYLAAAVSPITEAIRLSQARTFSEKPSGVATSGPAVLVLSEQLDVRAQTPETDAVLRTLVPPLGDERPIPAGAYNVAAQLLAVEAGIDAHEPSACVHLGDGRWLSLRAARVIPAGSSGTPDIAVTIEASSPAERRSLFTRSHALSRRETEVVEQLAGGADTRALAEALFISEHTVQDHLKSISAKAGTRTRRELLARISGG